MEPVYGHKKVKTSISLSPELLAALKQIAKHEDRSISYLLEKQLQEFIKKYRSKTPR